MGRSQLIIPEYCSLPLVTDIKTATSTGAGSTTLTFSAATGELWVVQSLTYYHDDPANRTVHCKLTSAGGDACFLYTETGVVHDVLTVLNSKNPSPVPIVLAGSRTLTVVVDALANNEVIYGHLCYYRMTGLGTWTDT